MDLQNPFNKKPQSGIEADQPENRGSFEASAPAPLEGAVEDRIQTDEDGDDRDTANIGSALVEGSSTTTGDAPTERAERRPRQPRQSREPKNADGQRRLAPSQIDERLAKSIESLDASIANLNLARASLDQGAPTAAAEVGAIVRDIGTAYERAHGYKAQRREHAEAKTRRLIEDTVRFACASTPLDAIDGVRLARLQERIKSGDANSKAALLELADLL
jgi:nucleoside 2-deoxyribosyltransferase